MAGERARAQPNNEPVRLRSDRAPFPGGIREASYLTYPGRLLFPGSLPAWDKLAASDYVKNSGPGGVYGERNLSRRGSMTGQLIADRTSTAKGRHSRRCWFGMFYRR